MSVKVNGTRRAMALGPRLAPLGQRESPHPARRGQPQRDDLHGRLGQRVRVEPLVGRVKSRDQRLDREAALRPRHRDLEALMAIAQVGQPRETAPRRGHALVGQPLVRLPLEIGVHRGEGGAVVVRRLLKARARVVVAHLGAEQTERRQHTGMARDHHRAHAQQPGQLGAVQRPRAAERDQRQLARVVAPLHRDQPDGADHVVVHDVEDAAGRGLERQPEWTRHALLDGPSRALDVERHLAA